MSQVSVIIPYYKKKKYILSTLKSVIQQTYKKFEIILIYDENDKKNLKFISKISKIDKRIKLIVNKKNLGVARSRNIGIRKSKYKYIAFIDSDDLWNKKKLDKQINFIKKNKCKICHTSYEIINENNKKIGYREAKTFNSKNELLKSCDIGLSTVLMEKKILKKNLKFPPLKTKEDFVLWLKILSNNYKILGMKDNLVKWRKSPSSLSTSISQKLFDGFKVYNYYMKFNFIISLYFLTCLTFNYLIKRVND